MYFFKQFYGIGATMPHIKRFSVSCLWDIYIQCIVRNYILYQQYSYSCIWYLTGHPLCQESDYVKITPRATETLEGGGTPCPS